ncbi:MAG: prephenate dehydratase [Elusimicrobiota bacterium]|jgi:chorismate mutase/prephenate dehydratase|nr:prephenate dehydratase [Elusimicrobiota bacterium]
MKIEYLRKKIDKIDDRIIDLLNDRFKVCDEIKKCKINNKLEVLNLKRENEILDKLSQKIEKPLEYDYFCNIYREILSGSRHLQSKIKVAFFGSKYSYTYIAGEKFFGKSCEYIPKQTINEVFDEVEKKNVKFGVVPVENSTEGIVNNTIDIMIDKDVNIYAELFLDIHHNLLSKETDLKNIEKIYSHAQAIAQTRNWCSKNLPNIQIFEAISTTEAVEIANKNNKVAAIASIEAGEKFRLNILAKNIEDKSNNKTRFFIISLDNSEKTKLTKTSIMFAIKDKIGALYDMLLPFKEQDINLTKIESRPNKKKAWEYVFFLDFIGYKDDKIVKIALKKLEKKCLFLKILGSYPTEL